MSITFSLKTTSCMCDVINIVNLSDWQEARSNNKDFPKEAIIKNRQERLLSICKQSKEQKFSCMFWEGWIHADGGWAGIVISFKRIVEYAKENNHKHCIIGEDDLIFSAPGAWNYYLDNMPEEFDFYSGGVYSGQIKDGRIVNGFSGITLLTINSTFYDRFLKLSDEALKERDHIDRRMGRYAFESNYRICLPYVVYQSQGYSDNLRRPTTHAAFLEKMKLFGC